VVIERLLSNMSLHSLLNAGAKIRINLETNKKKRENLHDSDNLSVFVDAVGVPSM
jgi:hypothetical protein